MEKSRRVDSGPWTKAKRLMEIPKPTKPEPNRYEASKNPKSEYRNPKQIQNSKVQKQQTNKRRLNFEHSDLFRISDFVLRIWNRPFALEVLMPSCAQLGS
jgi:hypothetical protein